MAITLVAKKTAVFVGGLGSNSIPLTSGWNTTYGSATYTPVTGDLVILTVCFGSTADRAVGPGTGNTSGNFQETTELYSNGSTTDTNFQVSYQVMGATPDTSIAAPGSLTSADAAAYVVEVYSGVDTTTPLDVAVATATGTGTARPDPAQITPTTAGAVVVVCGGGASGTGSVYTQSGSELSNFLSATSPDNNDAMVATGSFAWTSGAFDPVAWTGGTNNAGDSWAATTLALRPASGSSPQTLTPSLFTNSNSFHGPTITTGAVTLTPSLFTNAQTFPAATITHLIAPGLLTNTQTFFDSLVTVGAVTLTPSPVTNSQSFFAPTITIGLAPSLFTNTQTFHAPTVTGSATQDLTPALVANSQTFYSATVSPGAVTLAAPLFINPQTLAFPTGSNLAPNGTFDSDVSDWAAWSATPAAVVSWQAGRMRVARGAAGFQLATAATSNFVDGGTFVLTADFFNPLGLNIWSNISAGSGQFNSTAIAGGLQIVASIASGFPDPYLGIDDGSGSNGDYVEFDNVSVKQAFGATVISNQALAASLFVNSQVFYAATVAPGAVVLSPSLLTNAQAFFGPTVSAQTTLTPSLVSNTQVFHAPTLLTTYGLAPVLFTNDNEFFPATVSFPATGQDLLPALFVNPNEFFWTLVERGDPIRPRIAFDSRRIGLTPYRSTTRRNLGSRGR